jgi:hypothetical protein
LQAERQEKTTQLSEQEKVLTQVEKQRADILAKQPKGGPRSAEELAVEKLRAESISWDSFSRQPQDIAELKRIISTEGADITKAKTLLDASRKDWQTQVLAATSTGTKSREQRLQALKSMQQLFESKSRQSMIMVKMDDLVAADPLIAEVTKLLSTMTDGSRAVAGQNFTNSVGMEMVWVDEGGFWIGKTVLSSGAKGSHISAEDICSKLNKFEQRETGTLADLRRIKPANAEYGIPSVKQWQLAHGPADQLGLSGYSNSLSEWTADKYSPGITNTNTVSQFLPPKSSWFLVCRGNGDVEALPPETTGNITQSGSATVATCKPGSATFWTGNVGFRVILLPE